MVAPHLTQELIDEGARLIEKLDQSGEPPDAAFWFYLPESGTWRLFLAERKVAVAGSREVYKRMHKTLLSLRREVPHLSLMNVAVAEPDAPLVVLLSSAFPGRRKIKDARFMRTVINGALFDDAYVYRLKRPAA